MTQKVYQWKKDASGVKTMQKYSGSERKIFRLSDEDESFRYCVSSVDCTKSYAYVEPKRSRTKHIA